MTLVREFSRTCPRIVWP